MHLQYKYYNFMSWLKRHPLTTLIITIDPTNCREWTKMVVSLDDVRFHAERGHWRKCLFFTAKATPT